MELIIQRKNVTFEEFFVLKIQLGGASMSTICGFEGCFDDAAR